MKCCRTKQSKSQRRKKFHFSIRQLSHIKLKQIALNMKKDPKILFIRFLFFNLWLQMNTWFMLGCTLPPSRWAKWDSSASSNEAGARVKSGISERSIPTVSATFKKLATLSSLNCNIVWWIFDSTECLRVSESSRFGFFDNIWKQKLVSLIIYEHEYEKIYGHHKCRKNKNYLSLLFYLCLLNLKQHNSLKVSMKQASTYQERFVCIECFSALLFVHIKELLQKIDNTIIVTSK